MATDQSARAILMSAEEVRDRFREDLSSPAAQLVQRELASLGLPILHQIHDQFEDSCPGLGIGR